MSMEKPYANAVSPPLHSNLSSTKEMSANNPSHHEKTLPSISTSPTTATSSEEAAIIRKLDYRFQPFMLLLYTFAILDRSNIGNAKVAGMDDDLGMSSAQYAWLGTLFYISYILFQWTTIGWKQFKPHQWGAAVIFGWGVIATAQAAVQSWGGLMALRFLLGIFESAFGPGVPLYLSFFYPRNKIGFRHGVFISGAALANAYGSALAYGITQIKGSLAPWRILFIIEGGPTCLLAIAAYFFLPDSLATCKFLNEREKQVAMRMVAREQIVDEGKGKSGVRFRELWDGVKDPKSYLPALMYFSVNVSYASLPLFLPTIISEIGVFTTIQSQGLSAPPYLLAFFSILLMSWLSDRTRLRGPYVALAGTVGAIGFLLLATTTSPAARYTGTFLAVEVFVAVSLLLSWVANINASESRRAGGYVVMYTVGQCGPLLGTNVFPGSEKPFYRKGMWISFGFCVVLAVTAVVTSLWLRRENGRLEREGLLIFEGRGEDEGEIREGAGERSSDDEKRGKRHKYIL